MPCHVSASTTVERHGGSYIGCIHVESGQQAWQGLRFCILNITGDEMDLPDHQSHPLPDNSRERELLWNRLGVASRRVKLKIASFITG